MAKSFQKISTGNSPLYYALLNSSDWIRKLVMVVVVVVVYTYSLIIQNDIESFLAHALQFCQQIKQRWRRRLDGWTGPKLLPSSASGWD